MGQLNWKGKFKNNIAGVKEYFHKHDATEKEYIKDYGFAARKVLGTAREIGNLRSQIAKKMKKNKK